MTSNKTENSSQVLLTRKRVAEMLGCKESTLAIWKCTKRYDLPCIKIGRSVRYKLVDVEKFIETHMVKK